MLTTFVQIKYTNGTVQKFITKICRVSLVQGQKSNDPPGGEPAPGVFSHVTLCGLH